MATFATRLSFPDQAKMKHFERKLVKALALVANQLAA